MGYCGITGELTIHHLANKNPHLRHDGPIVVFEHIFCCAKVPFAARFKSWSPRSSKYLEHVQYGQIDKFALGTIVDLSPFNNDWDADTIVRAGAMAGC